MTALVDLNCLFTTTGAVFNCWFLLAERAALVLNSSAGTTVDRYTFRLTIGYIMMLDRSAYA